jgi:DNA-binding transcriptional MerR regulator
MGHLDRVTAPRLQKSPSAFRTISEVSAELDVPQHVLRFWETKFAQIRPLKRGGGRRYYRPEDVQLLNRIRELLYRDGYTIKGVQRLFRSDGPKGQPTADPPLRPALAEVAPHVASVIDGVAGTLPGSKRAALESVLRDLLEIREILRASTRARED